MYCTNCGKDIQEDDKFCPQCGQLINIESDLNYNRQQRKQDNKKSKLSKLIVLLVPMSILIVLVSGLVYFYLSKEGGSSKNLYRPIVSDGSDLPFNLVPAEISSRKTSDKLKSIEDELYDAVVNNDIEKASGLLEQGAVPGESLLASSQNKNYEMTKLLLDFGADRDFKKRGKTALNYAVENNDLQIAELLLDSGADPDEGSPMDVLTPLWRAVEKGSLEMVRLLLENGADPNGLAVNDKLPLYKAKELGYTKIYNLILQYGGMEELN